MTTTKIDISAMLANPIIQSEGFLRFQKLRWKLNLDVLIYWLIRTDKTYTVIEC